MAEPLFLVRAQVSFVTPDFDGTYMGQVELEVLDINEAYGLVVAALASKYPNLSSLVSISLKKQPGSNRPADDYSRFKTGEEVLGYNPICTMQDPLPAYTAWEVQEVAWNSGSDQLCLWIDKSQNMGAVAMVPYGVRKVTFNIHRSA